MIALEMASFSKFLYMFSNGSCHADSTNKWPLQMTFISDLDLTYFRILSHNFVPAE